ncbi:hypothetical protein FOXB_15862 [Fusarium oxysporum f. sp. conglutinans Fo5176]|uniref:VWFA domain-containing protein n=1 Tax=Fusarium oxysporum (strain Fo5176) TaxID=660025 RepID=F9GB29_FUSOF|nr:hypothetical protein FOXB_15862 [Fusarium oxysporum f. sp. conglutinans Fo5176]
MFSRIKDKFSIKKSSTENHTHFDIGNSNTTLKSNPFLDVPEEAPPAYEPTQKTVPLLNVPRRGASPAPSISSITSAEDKYAFLSTFDTIFVIDDSGSMAGRSWREVPEALSTIARICTSHDPDGIDVYFLNHRSSAVGTEFKHPVDISRSVMPTKSNICLSPSDPAEQPQQVLVFTAFSSPTSPTFLAVRPTLSQHHQSIIVHHAKKLDQIEAPPHQVGIQFFQVGNELGATKALRELDDDLADQGIRDMVDTATWNSTTSENSEALTADGILKVVLGAVISLRQARSVKMAATE